MRAFVEEAAGISRYKERRKRDRGAHRRHAREPRAPAGRARRSRQADPPPAAPGRHRAPLPGAEGAGAPPHRRAAGAAAARPRQWRRGAGQRRCASASWPCRRRWPSSAPPRRRSRTQRDVHTAQQRARCGGAGALLRGGRRDHAPRTERSSTRASCASASAPIWRRRTPRWPSWPAHIERDEQQLAAVRAELAQLAPELERAQRAEAHARRRRSRRPSAQLQDWQQRWEALQPRAVGAADQTTQVEARAHRAAGESAAAPDAPRRSASPRNTSALSAAGCGRAAQRSSTEDEDAGARAQRRPGADAGGARRSSVQALRAAQLAAESAARGRARRARDARARNSPRSRRCRRRR